MNLAGAFESDITSQITNFAYLYHNIILVGTISYLVETIITIFPRKIGLFVRMNYLRFTFLNDLFTILNFLSTKPIDNYINMIQEFTFVEFIRAY